MVKEAVFVRRLAVWSSDARVLASFAADGGGAQHADTGETTYHEGNLTVKFLLLQPLLPSPVQDGYSPPGSRVPDPLA